MQVLLAGVAALASCTSSTPPADPPVATSINVIPPILSFDEPGGNVALSATVLDQHGQSFVAPVNFESGNEFVVRVVGAQAVAVTPGQTSITARSGNLTESVSATVGPFPTDPEWMLLPTSPTAPGGISFHFMDASFISPQEGWVVGIPGLVHHTSDGGATWESRNSSPTSQQLFRAAAFVSPSLGWIGDVGTHNATEGPAIWETRDGGVTWTSVRDRIIGPLPVGICGMFAIDAQTVVGVGRWHGPAVFVRTDDAGATWSSVSLAPLATGAVDLHFFDSMNGIIVGGRGVGSSQAEQQSSRVVILGTQDGGTTWQERYAGSQLGVWSWKVSFPSPDVGYVATQGPNESGVVIKTVDGGQTWTPIQASPAGVGGGFWGIGFVTPDVGWVSRTHSADPLDPVHDVYETRNGGQTWTRRNWAAGQSINRFRLFPGGGGFAVGNRVFRYAEPASVAR